MGARPYKYVVPWQLDLNRALQDLRREVFERGDFRGAEAGFATPEEALDVSAGGTRSILDITKITEDPGLCAASGFDHEELDYYFGSTTPAVRDIEKNDVVWTDIERGSARYVVAYEGGQPHKIVFLGYAFD